MIENAKKMSCGNCASQTFTVYQSDETIVIECQGCKSSSVLRVTTPRIMIDWGENSDGILCILHYRGDKA